MLHNKVETIDAFADKLRTLIPEATFIVAHFALNSRSFRFAARFFPTDEMERVAVLAGMAPEGEGSRAPVAVAADPRLDQPVLWIDRQRDRADSGKASNETCRAGQHRARTQAQDLCGGGHEQIGFRGAGIDADSTVASCPAASARASRSAAPCISMPT